VHEWVRTAAHLAAGIDWLDADEAICWPDEGRAGTLVVVKRLSARSVETTSVSSRWVETLQRKRMILCTIGILSIMSSFLSRMPYFLAAGFVVVVEADDALVDQL
jgi:hypothetical protein